MDTYQIVLSDADEIEQFFLETTGMKPGYMQLSRGLADLRIRIVELAGVSLIWTRARGRARWRDQMTGDGLHIAFAIESDGPISVRGHDVNRDEAQVWMPDKEMDLILDGPNLTLDIGVESHLVEEKGWEFTGDPLRRLSQKHLNKLLNTCSRASDFVRSNKAKQQAASDVEMEILRNDILQALDPVLQPWQTAIDHPSGAVFKTSSYYRLVREADDFFDAVGLQDDVAIDQLIDQLKVPRRTLFHSFNKVLGIGPRRYLEIKRLHALRARLRKTTYLQTTVSNIAAELGFTDVGRLATVYRRHFGEKPSETLRFG